jgi:DEAD/DEAH box helicase domain-containing protein
VGTVDGARACELVHPGAIYLHQGRPHLVVDLDLDDGVAIVEPDDGTTYTLARTDVVLRLLSVDRTEPLGRLELGLGAVEVTSRVTGYQRREVLTGAIVGHEDLDLPPSQLVTRGYWWVVPPAVLRAARIAEASVPGALHAAEHAAIGILPLFTICDRWDVGGVSTPWLDDTGGPTIVIYDGHPGGAGVAELGFEFASQQLQATLDVLDRCRCRHGCPSCVQSPKCGSWNEPLDKRAAARLLRAADVAEPGADQTDQETAGSSTIMTTSAESSGSGTSGPTSGRSVGTR